MDLREAGGIGRYGRFAEEYGERFSFDAFGRTKVKLYLERVCEMKPGLGRTRYGDEQTLENSLLLANVGAERLGAIKHKNKNKKLHSWIVCNYSEVAGGALESWKKTIIRIQLDQAVRSEEESLLYF